MRSPLALAALVTLAASSLAQTAPLPSIAVDYPWDSGWAESSPAAGSCSISQVVAVDGAAWLRLEFADVALSGEALTGTGALLRITSLLDAAVQELDPLEVAQWRNASAYFNGDAVLVEVVAPPSTGQSRLVLERVIAGVAPASPESQCGPTDDRQPLSDGRLARLLPGGCTGFIVEDCEHCLLTAGHCAASLAVAEFNVPLSNANGAIVHPSPQDQYSVDPSSVQFTNGGLGNDWCRFGCFANASTGLSPFAAQGAGYFDVATPPATPTGQYALILGFGVDNTPATYNQTLQFAAGPWIGHVGTQLQYTADTEGGNSGSPVCLNQTFNAFGIHTHGGCTSTGGYNAGTSAEHSGLQAAIANPQGICAFGITPIGAAPSVLVQGVSEHLTVQIRGSTVAGSERMHYRYGSGAFVAQTMTPLGGGAFEGVLPPGSCGEVAEWYFSVQHQNCGTLTHPAGGASSALSAQVGNQTLHVAEDFDNTGGWQDASSGGGPSGRWELATPVDNPGCPLDPPGDSGANGRCWVTDDGCGDVDSTPRPLQSPTIDVNASTPLSIRYDYFLGLSDTSGPDYLAVQVGTTNSNQVSSWTEVRRYTASTAPGWATAALTELDLAAAGITLLDKIGLRFVAVDGGVDSTVEAGVDMVFISSGTCGGVGRNYCVSGALGSVISATGSASIAADDLALHASNVPPGKSGLFYYGATVQATPFGNGTRCVATPTYRMPLVNSGAGTTLDFDVAYAALPSAGAITAGSTWNFQAWFRDGTGSFDLSDGLEITFVP